MTVHTKILPRRSKWTGSTPPRRGVPAPGKNDMGDDHGAGAKGPAHRAPRGHHQQRGEPATTTHMASARDMVTRNLMSQQSALNEGCCAGTVTAHGAQAREARSGAIHPRTTHRTLRRGDRHRGRHGHDVLPRPLGRPTWDGRTLVAARYSSGPIRILAMVGTPTNTLNTRAPPIAADISAFA